MKAYLLNLIESDINILQCAYEKNKYKDIKKRLEAAKKSHNRLKHARIDYDKKSVKKTIPNEVKEQIEQHLRNGEKQVWICAKYDVGIATVSRMNALIKKEKEQPA